MDKRAVIAVVIVQFICASFFLWNILSSVFGVATFSWQVSEYIELATALGLWIGVGFGAVILKRSQSRAQLAETRLRAASAEFMELMRERFEFWCLTPAEKDVALFAIKGLNTSEIAALRNTSEGTVKAQTNSIFRKAGVTGRPQLLSLFIDDLMDETVFAHHSNIE